MKKLLKRIAHAIADIITSKKGQVAIAGLAAGVDPKVVIAGYLIGQGIADHGKGAVVAAQRGESYRLDKNGQPATP